MESLSQNELLSLSELDSNLGFPSSKEKYKYEYFFKSQKYPKYDLAETYYYDDNFNLIKKNNSNINAKENKEKINISNNNQNKYDNQKSFNKAINKYNNDNNNINIKKGNIEFEINNGRRKKQNYK